MRSRENSDWGTHCVCPRRNWLLLLPATACAADCMMTMLKMLIKGTSEIKALHNCVYGQVNAPPLSIWRAIYQPLLSIDEESELNHKTGELAIWRRGAIKLSVPRFGPSLSRGRLDAAVTERSSISFFLFERSRFSWEGDWIKERTKNGNCFDFGRSFAGKVVEAMAF